MADKQLDDRLQPLARDRSKVEVRAKPVIGIVVPLYKQPSLALEAVQSAVRQDTAVPSVVVIVNDGCPLPESGFVGSALRGRRGASQIDYVFQRNKGLSAARNAGIDYILKNYPEVRGIFFLDSDNRLQPYSLRMMMLALDEHPDTGWFYPDIIMFGFPSTTIFDGEYSLLAHTRDNISEAGSLVSRAVFEAGVRFDENMRLGYEDWEFWLSAAEAGFRGRHWPSLGFRYRQRGESMLTNSRRHDAEIKGYIRERHPWVNDPLALKELAFLDGPSFLVITESRAFFAADPRLVHTEFTHQVLLETVWSWMLQPRGTTMAPYAIFVTDRVLGEILGSKACHWLFWDLERRACKSGMASICIKAATNPVDEVGQQIADDLEGVRSANIVAIKMDILRTIIGGPSLQWIVSVLDGQVPGGFSSRDVCLSDVDAALCQEHAAQVAIKTFAAWHGSSYRKATEISWERASHSGMPQRQWLAHYARDANYGGELLPRRHGSGKDVAIVTPIADFGGAERVGYQVARELRQYGFVPHLVCFSARAVRVPPEFRDVFETISWFPEDGLEEWSGPQYYGTSISEWAKSGDRRPAIGLLSAFDAVINCNCADAHAVAADLRRLGIVTICYQHVADQSPSGRPVGHPYFALAYEAAYDLIVTCSDGLRVWMIGHGVPSSKVMSVPNSLGFTPDLPVLRQAQAGRSTLRTGALNCAFIGRLDRQKGIDRLARIIQMAEAEGIDLNWRVVGKPITDAAHEVPPFLMRMAEPAVYSGKDLSAILAWADILILPSRFEGLPLSLIEGATFGVVSIVADTGAVGEAIIDGHNGFVVSQGDCERQTVQYLKSLAENREMLSEMASNALASSALRDWGTSVAPLAVHLEKAIGSRKRTAVPKAIAAE